MRLSIITINRNNAEGLRRTLQSVNAQNASDFEHIVVDGASTDESVQVIRQCETDAISRSWISEPDTGIYNAMNKGIRMAKGEYIQILNSGDCLASPYVVERMLTELQNKKYPNILYGNMIKVFPNGHTRRDRSFAGKPITFLGFYGGTLNHSPAYVRKSLFEKYGMYDESLRIVSDWKWYMDAIIFGDETPLYTDIDITLFDMTGVSETNTELTKKERRQVLEEKVSRPILNDYDSYAFSMGQINRLRRFPFFYKLFYWMERILFKWEQKTKKNQEIG